MPEVLSKYPDVVLRVLQGGGARCGEKAKPRILKRCPPKQFCSLPTGEICVYGLRDIPKMTQIRTEELAAIVCRSERSSATDAAFFGTESVALVVAFGVGLVLGRFLRLWPVRKHQGERS